MSHLSRSWFAFWLCVLPVAALACLWDNDTLEQERSRYPTTLELITGKFLRHSPEFYAWRIKDRLLKLERHPDNLALYDDLAVAYEKTGQHQLALETIRKKNELKPDVYETLSNLGTFHILAGELEEGLPYINRALEIDPNAHFGREKYQKWLVEYALTRKRNGKLRFPLRWDHDVPEKEEYKARLSGFQEFLQAKVNGDPLPTAATLPHDFARELTQEQLAEAIAGVQGMMRFADHTNPILLEALGDLLTTLRPFGDNPDAKLLAGRCYLKAAYEIPDIEAKRAYRKLAESALREQRHGDLNVVERDFTKDLADADKWYAELKQKEMSWIRSNADVEAEFRKLYAGEPIVKVRVIPRDRTGDLIGLVCVLLWLASAAVPFGIFYWWRGRAARFRPVKEIEWK